jgi:hypothetical protein
MKITSKEIKELMELKGWNRYQLAVATLHNERTVSNWVSDKNVPNLLVQQKIRTMLAKARADKARAEGGENE